MTTKLLLIQTLATFGDVGTNCIGEPTVTIPIPAGIRSTNRFANTTADRIERQLTEQEIAFRCTGGIIGWTEEKPYRPIAVELSFVPNKRTVQT